MPATRSASNAIKSSSSTVEANLKKNSGRLTSKNRPPEEEIDWLHNEAEASVQPRPVKSRSKDNSLLHVKVKELELEVRRLKKARTLDRKKIKQLRLKEARKDAEELQDEGAYDVLDIEHSLKKLLRHFHRVISSPSLAEDEECSICAESLELNKCSSLPCQHIFCDSCLTKMSAGENISCPQCRRLSDIDNFEPVEFTATQQWDQLLEIAQQFAAIEGQLGPDTSEEEEEENLRENFIDDGDSEASTNSQDHETQGGMPEDELDGDAEGEHILYSQSGVSEKRRRMKQLVAEREHKRMRT